MANNNFEQQICQAIETIVNQSIANANFDRTIQATVISCTNAARAEYEVKYQDSRFYAYATNTEVKYSDNTPVYILIPGNNMEKPKTIIGTVKNLGIEYTSIVDEEESYEQVGINVITSSDTFDLCSYNESTVKILYDYTKNNNLISVNTRDTEEYFKQSEAIKCSAVIKTSLPAEQRYKGNYGIVYELDFKKSDESIVTEKYILDVNHMTGNPYYYNTINTQSSIYEFDAETFVRINKIYIFSYGFPNIKSDQPADIFINDIQICGMNHIDAENLNGVALTLKTPQGSYFDNTDTTNAEKIIEAQVRVKGKVIEPTNSSLKYFWFYEDLRITSSSDYKMYYNENGGDGWKCLNDYRVIDNETVEWINNDYILTVKKSDFLAKYNKLKCVVIYNDTIVIEKEITITNYSSQYDISIKSDSGEIFHFDMGTPSLTCLINENNIITTDYKYQWAKIDNVNTFELLYNTTEYNDEYNNAAMALRDILNEIDTEQAWPAATQQQREQLQSTLNKYNEITRIENNKIFKIQIKNITNYNIYKCAVYYQGDYIGSSSIKLINSFELEDSYSLIINNGSQVFKYNEKGLAPTNQTLDNPLIINPLTFDLYDINGEIIDIKSIKREGSIQWIVPKKNTLLSIPAIYNESDIEIENDDYIILKNLEQLSYEIKNNYSITSSNNTIQLVIKYKTARFVATTNFTFTKEGEDGTNGTAYVVRIVPYTNENIPENVIVSNGQLNYQPLKSKTWFTVELWKDGQRIFNSYASGNSTEGKNVSIQWSVLRNKYTSSIYDNTALTVNNNGEINYTSTFDITNHPANIIKCTLIYDGITHYATIPIITVKTNNDYTINLKDGSGFKSALYTTDGLSPAYNTTNPFELIVKRKINEIYEDVSEAITDDYKIDYEWKPMGQVYNVVNQEWIQENIITISNNSNENLKRNQKRIRLPSEYIGQCVTTGILVSLKQNNTLIGQIHIPIHLYINRYGNAALNGWDGNSIDINNGEGFILAPQVGAGEKNSDNTFTGVLMGKVQEAGKYKIEKGLFGYANGQRSFFVDAETGKAEFGVNGKGQIIIDPTNDKAQIYSGDYKQGTATTGKGLMIDLTTPEIRFGTGNFVVDKNGHLTAKGGGTIAGWEISDTALIKDYVGMSSKNTDNSGNNDNTQIAFWAGKNSNNKNTAPFRVNFKGDLWATNAEITGKVWANYIEAKTEGNIGGFNLNNNSLTVGSENNAVGISSSGSYAFWAGNENAINAPFRVGFDGSLYGNNVTLTGEIHANSGSTIGPWNISDTAIWHTTPTFSLTNYNDGVYLGIDGIMLGATSINSSGTLQMANSNGAGQIAMSPITCTMRVGEVLISREQITINGQRVALKSEIPSGCSCSSSSESDARLKYDIVPTEVNALDTIDKINLRQFNWIEDDEFESIGYISNELEKANDSLIYNRPQYNKDGEIIDYIKEVKLASLSALHTKALQEANAKINKLEQIIDYLLEKSNINIDDIPIEQKEKIIPEITIEEYGKDYQRSYWDTNLEKKGD